MRGDMPRVGVTATGFRGTPKETAILHKTWDEIIPVLSWSTAVANGWVSMPNVHIVPIHNDDEITIRGADFQVRGKNGVNALIGPTLERLVTMIQDRWDEDSWRPTMVTLPSTDLVAAFCSAAADILLPVVAVVQATKPEDRVAAFGACVTGKAILVQIGVVGEGVDLPIRTIWDCKPTLSAVAWQQLIGRGTRPVEQGEARPTVYCTNRNVERHGYLLEGMVPRSVYKEAQDGFGGPTKRAGLRRLGLEAMARFKPISIPLADGTDATGFALQRWDNDTGRQHHYFAVVLPYLDDVLFAERTNTANADGSMAWGRWRRTELPEDLRGFATGKPGPFSDAQKKWWREAAARHGLNNAADVDKRTFSVLPVLRDLHIVIR
jgi:hypothetical protein